jgi:hypothetical protein
MKIKAKNNESTALKNRLQLIKETKIQTNKVEIFV